MPDLPSGRVNPSLFVLSKTLYCIGGCSSNSNDVYMLNLINGTFWEALPGTLPILGQRAVIPLDDHSVVLLGGNNHLNETSDRIDKISFNPHSYTIE